MSGHADVARALYLELRALGLGVRVEEAAGEASGPLDYGIAVEGLHTLPEFLARSVDRRIRENEDGLVRVLLDRRDPDLDAVRTEGYCRR